MFETKKLTANADKELHRKVRVEAARQGFNVQRVILTFFDLLVSGDPAAKKIVEESKRRK